MGDRVLNRYIAVDRREMVRICLVDLLVAHDRASPAGVDDEGRDLLVRFVVGDPPEDDRMGPTSVVAPMCDHIRELDVLVSGRRRVTPERLEVARDRGGHAHTGVGLDRVRPEDTLHEQVLEPLAFDRELTGSVEPDRVPAEFLIDSDDLIDDDLVRLLPRRLAEDVVAETTLRRALVTRELVGHVPPDERLGQPIDVDRLGAGEPLDALQPVVRRVLRVRHHADDLALLGLNQRPAADPAVWALGQDVVWDRRRLRWRELVAGVRRAPTLGHRLGRRAGLGPLLALLSAATGGARRHACDRRADGELTPREARGERVRRRLVEHLQVSPAVVWILARIVVVCHLGPTKCARGGTRLRPQFAGHPGWRRPRRRRRRSPASASGSCH